MRPDRPRGALAGRPAVDALVLGGVLLLAANLRPALASVAPVLTQVQGSTGLSTTVAAMLTTIPLLAFGACAPLAPVFGRRFGIEATVLGVLGLLAAGILVRSTPSLVALFAGTVAVGVAISAGNVLVPALIKRDFPTRVRQVTGLYSVGLATGAAMAAGVTVPLERATGAGWRVALALWAVPAAAAGVLLWVRHTGDTRRDIASVHVSGRLWRDAVAWQVTAFMGLQSLEFYTLLAWIPTILEQHAVHPAAAGWLLSLSGLANLPSAFAAPVLGSTPTRQRMAVFLAVALTAGGVLGLLWAPTAEPVVWMVLLGLGQGAAVSLALSFVVLRSHDSTQAAELAAMAQTVGYVVAGLGPFAVGAVRQWTGSWAGPLVLLAALLVPELASGLQAGRPRFVGRQGSGKAASPLSR